MPALTVCQAAPVIVASLKVSTMGPYYATAWYTPTTAGLFRITVSFISTVALAETVSFTATDEDGNDQGGSILSSAPGLFANISKVFNLASGTPIDLTIIPNNSYTVNYIAYVILEQLA